MSNFTIEEESVEQTLAPKYLIEAESVFPNEWSFDKHKVFRTVCSDIIWDCIYNLQNIEPDIRKVDYIVKKASHWCALVYTCSTNIEIDTRILKDIFIAIVEDIMLSILLETQFKVSNKKIVKIVSKTLQDVLKDKVNKKLIKQDIADKFILNYQQLFLMYNSNEEINKEKRSNANTSIINISVIIIAFVMLIALTKMIPLYLMSFIIISIISCCFICILKYQTYKQIIVKQEYFNTNL